MLEIHAPESELPAHSGAAFIYPSAPRRTATSHARPSHRPRALGGTFPGSSHATPGVCPPRGRRAPGRAPGRTHCVDARCPGPGAAPLTCVLQGQAAFLRGRPVLGALGRAGGVGPPRRVQAGQHQRQGHPPAQPRGTHGSGANLPAETRFFVLPSSALARSPARIEVTQRPPVALRRPCDPAVRAPPSAGQWQGRGLKYPRELWCHLHEGVEQVLSRRLDQWGPRPFPSDDARRRGQRAQRRAPPNLQPTWRACKRARSEVRLRVRVRPGHGRPDRGRGR